MSTYNKGDLGVALYGKSNLLSHMKYYVVALQRGEPVATKTTKEGTKAKFSVLFVESGKTGEAFNFVRVSEFRPLSDIAGKENASWGSEQEEGALRTQLENAQVEPDVDSCLRCQSFQKELESVNAFLEEVHEENEVLEEKVSVLEKELEDRNDELLLLREENLELQNHHPNRRERDADQNLRRLRDQNATLQDRIAELEENNESRKERKIDREKEQNKEVIPYFHA